jgi:hypothetical protein
VVDRHDLVAGLDELRVKGPANGFLWHTHRGRLKRALR